MLTCHHEVYQRLPGILISLPGYVPCKAPPLFAFNGLPLLPCSSCLVVLIFETTLAQLFGGLGRLCLNSVAHQLVNIWSSPDMSACEYEDMRPYCRVGTYRKPMETSMHVRPPPATTIKCGRSRLLASIVRKVYKSSEKMKYLHSTSVGLLSGCLMER
jgi:hypothetical protein